MKFFNVKEEILNSIILGIVFMTLYSAFYTWSNLEGLILHSINKDNPEFKGDGFTCLSILYISFALFMWFVPAIMSAMGPKWTLTLGAMGFCIPLISLLLEQSWLLYVSSVCNGVGAAMLWLSQAVYMMFNSTPSTVARNTAMFAGLCHSSMVYGNLFVYFSFAGKTVIDKETRTFVLLGLLILTLLAVMIAVFLPPPAYMKENDQYRRGALQEIKQSWAVARSKNMLLLTPMFLYTGLQISYLSGVFGAAVGFTTYSDGFPSNQLVPITGVFTGVGEIIAEVFLLSVNCLLSSRSWAPSLIVVLGILSDCFAFGLSFLIYSNNSVFSPTTDPTIISSRSWIAVVIGLLLGFGDGLFMPMLLSLIKKMYPKGNASTLTVYTFCFSFGSAIGFFLSDFVGLHWQLLILAAEGMLGMMCYCYVNSVIRPRFTNGQTGHLPKATVFRGGGVSESSI